MPTTDTQVNNLIINKLTKQQYESIQNPSDTELYLVPDEIDSTPTSGSENPVESGGVYDALQDKADKVSGATNGNFAGLDSNGNLTDSGYKPSDFVLGTELPAYTISRLGTPETGYVASYILQKDGVQEGATINIPKDYLVRSGEFIDVVEYNGQYYDSTDTGHTNPLPVSSDGKYLDFTVNTSDSGGTEQHIYIAVDDLVDVYTAGNGIDISNSNVVSIKIDSTNSNGISVGSNGLALSTVVASSGGTGGSAGAMSAQDKEKLNSIASGAEVNVQSDWNQTDNTADDYIKNKPTALSDFTDDIGVSGKADKVQNAVDGNLAGLDSNGNLTDSGKSVSDFPLIATGGDGPNGLEPLFENVYENYTCSAADINKGYIFFIKVFPTSENYYEPWHIRYTLEVSTSNAACQGFYDITIGSTGTGSQYHVFNKFYSSSYAPLYYHLLAYHGTLAKYENRSTYPIRVGGRIWSAYQSTTLARTYTIKVYETHGCTIQFPDNIETYDSFYSDANYGYLGTINATTVGTIDNYDANTIPYQYYEQYVNYRLHDASAPLYRYKICGFDSDNKLVPFTITERVNATQNIIFPTQVPMKVGNGMVYYNSTTSITTPTGRTSGGTIYRGYTQGNTPFVYTFNGLPPTNCTIYACGSYDTVRGEFTFDTSGIRSWYVCVPDSVNQDTDPSQYFTKGMYYWLIGVIGSNSSIYGALYLEHPVYMFDGKELVSIDDSANTGVPSRWNNQIFTNRSTYGKNSTESTIDKIMGMSLSWNQKALEYAVTNGTTSTSDGITTVTPNSSDCRYILRTVSGTNNTTPMNTSLYLQVVTVKSDAPVSFANADGGMVGNSPVFDFQPGDDFKRCYDMFRASSSTASTIQMYSPTGDTFYVKEGSFMLFNLTDMFGYGHEPDAKTFFEWFPRESYDYCNGRIIDSYVGQETITTYDNEGNQVDSVQVGSSTVLRSAAFDFDEIEGTTKITRVGSVNLGDLTWTVHTSSKRIFQCVDFSTTYGADKTKGSSKYTTLLCGGGYNQRLTDNTIGNLADGQFFLGNSSGNLIIRDTRYSTADAFAAAVDGVYLNFPLLTPVESTIEDIGTPSYKCSLDGTEEAVNARQSSLESTPTCTPFRCCMEYTPYNGGGGSSEKITEITHAEIVDLLDNSQLVAGHRYKITDYKCSLTDSVSDSYWNKRFDGLYVTAISEDTLDENATLSLNELLQPMTIDGNSFSIKYNKEACPVKYTVENIPGLSDTETREILENYHYFDCTDPVGLRNATLENIASAGYTPYDHREMYSVDIDGTTYYTKGNPSEMTAGAYSLLCSEGPGSNEYMIHINYYSVGVLVKNQDNSYSYTTDPVILYDTGQTHTIEDYGYEYELKILCENKDYVAGDECYLHNDYPYDYTYKGHYDTVTGDWVLTSISDIYHAIVEGDKYTRYGGMGSIYFMRDMNGNESVFDFKSRTTNSGTLNGNFYLGSSVFFDGTDTGYKIDQSSVSEVYDDLGDTNLYVSSASNNRILSKSPYYDFNIVSVFHSYGTGQGGYIYINGIEDNTFGDVQLSPKNQITGGIHDCNFISGNLNECLYISGSVHSQTVVRDSDYETLLFGNGDDTRYLIDNVKLFSLSDAEMTDDNHTSVDVSYNTDYRYKYLEIPAFTRIKIVPNTSTSRISDYSESSCLIDDEPYSGDSFGYADCVFVEGNTTRKGKFKIGDWNGSGDIEFITLERSYLCLNVYNQTEDQELGTDNVFYVNAGPKRISILDDEPGDGIAVGLLTILTSKEELLRNALDVAASGNVRRMTSQPATGMLPNTVYDLGTITSNTTFTMAAPSDNGIANIWHWSFNTPATAPTITWPAFILEWNGGTVPTINASKRYEISVMDGIACFIETDIPAS